MEPQRPHRRVGTNVNRGVTLPPFQTLLDAHAHDVHRFLVGTVGRVDADDCYQETWIAALRAYPRLRDAGNLRGWLLTIASRKAIDHIRAGRRAPVPVGAEPSTAAAREDEHFFGDDDLWMAVRELPAKQRAAIAMRYELDADYALIASTMGTSVEAARRNVHEGLKRLRREVSR
jgi:RNA polymerase sigma factor (sigma-70 family)